MKQEHDAKKLYKDLCKDFPELKEKPDTWIKTIEALIETKPQDEMDDQFYHSLRDEVEQLIHMQKAERQEEKVNPLTTFKRVLLTLAGGVTVVAALVITLNMSPQDIHTELAGDENSKESKEVTLLKNDYKNGLVEIEESGADAFGELNVSPDSHKESMADSLESFKGFGGDEAMELSILPFPGGREKINYNYLLPEKTDDIQISSSSKLYKKLNEAKKGDFSNVFKLLNLDSLDLSRFADTELRQINFKGNVNDIAYIINVDLKWGNVNLYIDHESQLKLDCPSWPNCAESKPLKEEDRLNDEELIQIATDFLEAVGANTSQVAKPYVNKPWEENPHWEASSYIQEEMTVIFPYELNGNIIHESWGGKTGINVSINQRKKRASGLNLSSLKLISSDYESLSKEDILKQAEAGGLNGFIHVRPEKTVDIKLKKPHSELRTFRRWNKNQEETYYVQMLVFETIKTEEKDDDDFAPNEVLVPLPAKIKIQ